VARFMTQDDAVVPMQHPALLIDYVCRLGVPLGHLLRDTGIPEGAIASPDARISYQQFGSLVLNALAATEEPALGLHYGARIQIQHQGMLGLLIMSSATLGDALEASLAFHHMVAPGRELEVEVHGERAHLVMRDVLPMGRLTTFAHESTVVSYDVCARQLVPGFQLQELRLAYPRPQHVDSYPFPPPCRLVFDAERTELIFDAALLDSPLASPDPVTAALARRHCLAALPPSTRSLLTRIRDHLDGNPGRYPSMQELASTLGTSPRSLRRHLRALSTNYQTMVDEARRRHAEDAVRSTAMTVQELADFLGYGDARGFRRAWRRWTGQTPTGYRAALQM